MAKKKKAAPPPPSPVRSAKIGWLRLVSYLAGPGQNAVLVTLVLVCFLGGVLLIWQQVGPHVQASARFRLQRENIVATPQPNWIRRDVKSDTLRAAHLEEGMSLLEPDLAERLAKEFRLHPWVADAKVQIVPEGKVLVELKYRRPSVVVATSAEYKVPVDDQGYLLPLKDFTPDELKSMPLVWNIQSPPAAEGTQWKDSRVLGAVHIARFIAEQSDLPHLAEIRPTQKLRRPKDEISYELLTAEKMTIVWGSPPGEERPDEMLAADKLTQFRGYLAEHTAGPTEIVKLSEQKLSVIPSTVQREEAAKY